MNQAYIQAKEWAELEQMKSFLDKMGLPSLATPQSDHNPVNLLSIQLSGQLHLHVIFIPLPAETFSEVSLLQFYALVKEGIDAEDIATLRLLNRINEKLPLGAFLVNADQELVYKYVLAKDKTSMLSETFFIELLTSLVPPLEGQLALLGSYLSGQTPLSAALESLES
ncbi:MAG: hypothetical protein FJX89_09670 [Bacteroidetes bacterium]|nr:hypothetical protein [Bacteroidota bacterium]